MTPIILPDGISCACEANDWRRLPGDGGAMICCATCGSIAAIVSEGGSSTSPGISLHVVTLTLCSMCLLGEGGECHTPGCALWMKAAPDVPLYPEAIGKEAGQ